MQIAPIESPYLEHRYNECGSGSAEFYAATTNEMALEVGLELC